jgi:hypothetical protein
MPPKDTPARRWAEHRYDTTQREWQEELTSEVPDWSELAELEQQLCALEAYLMQLELDEWL